MPAPSSSPRPPWCEDKTGRPPCTSSPAVWRSERRSKWESRSRMRPKSSPASRKAKRSSPRRSTASETRRGWRSPSRRAPDRTGQARKGDRRAGTLNVARFATRNARAILFGVAFVTLIGVYSIGALPSGIYPEVEFPRIAIVAQSGDLSPRIMLVAVTRPIEEAAREVLGVRRVRSRTIRGATEISVIFNPDADMPYALQLMQGKVDEVRPDLPTGTEMRVERMTPSLFPMMSFNVTGDLPAADLRDIAMFQIRPLLSRIPGVSRVDVSATDEREFSVIVDPDKLNAAKVTLDQVSEALKHANQVTSVGRLPKDYQQFLVLATGELTT